MKWGTKSCEKKNIQVNYRYLEYRLKLSNKVFVLCYFPPLMGNTVRQQTHQSCHSTCSLPGGMLILARCLLLWELQHVWVFHMWCSDWAAGGHLADFVRLDERDVRRPLTAGFLPTGFPTQPTSKHCRFLMVCVWSLNVLYVSVRDLSRFSRLQS